MYWRPQYNQGRKEVLQLISIGQSRLPIRGLFLAARAATGTTCRARFRDWSLSVSVYACLFSCFSDARSIAKFRGSWLVIRGSLIKVRKQVCFDTSARQLQNLGIPVGSAFHRRPRTAVERRPYHFYGSAGRLAPPAGVVAGRTAVRTAARLCGMSPTSFWRKSSALGVPT